MKTTPILRALALVLTLTSTALQAQVPQILNYQGRVAVGTTNFDGSGGFKFALVQGEGPTLQAVKTYADTNGYTFTNAGAGKEHRTSNFQR